MAGMSALLDMHEQQNEALCMTCVEPGELVGDGLLERIHAQSLAALVRCPKAACTSASKGPHIAVGE